MGGAEDQTPLGPFTETLSLIQLLVTLADLGGGFISGFKLPSQQLRAGASSLKPLTAISGSVPFCAALLVVLIMLISRSVCLETEGC